MGTAKLIEGVHFTLTVAEVVCVCVFLFVVAASKNNDEFYVTAKQEKEEKQTRTRQGLQRGRLHINVELVVINFFDLLLLGYSGHPVAWYEHNCEQIYTMAFHCQFALGSTQMLLQLLSIYYKRGSATSMST